jgi:hypothetical protein
MGKIYDALTPDLRAWLALQKLFFVATAPLAAAGHVNCSPKGTDTFRVLGEREVAYLDLTGSGIESVSHLQENGRIVLMFCAFEESPKIVRLHGRGEVIYPDHPDYSGLSERFPPRVGARSIIRVTLTRISDSCGFGVPRLDFVEQRDAMDRWAEKKGPEGVAAYRREKNQLSIDGIPGYKKA